MTRARRVIAAGLAVGVALAVAAASAAPQTRVLAIGGFSSQAGLSSARIGATLSAGSPLSTRPSAPAVAAPGTPTPPPPPTLPSNSPLLSEQAPDGPGSLWYQGPPGQACIYVSGASPACYLIVGSAGPRIDLPANAAALASQLDLTLAAIAASPAASRAGLTGATSWFWLETAPRAVRLSLALDGETVTVSASPGAVAWDFGDGTSVVAGSGVPYTPGPVPLGAVTHVFQTRCLPGDRGADPYVLSSCGPAGYAVTATVGWQISYTAAGPIAVSGELAPRTTSVSLTYPVSEVRAFLGGPA